MTEDALLVANTLLNIKCEQCGKLGAVRRRQNTLYAEDDSNFHTLCAVCQKEADDYWQERWDEYYYDQQYLG